MEVKKLEWINKDVFLGSTNRLYVIRPLSISLINDVKNFNGSTEEAKQICQSHYESFILSQIEPDHNMVEHDIAKPFDPLLMGFEYTGIDPQEGKEYLLWFDEEKTILSGKIYHNQTYNTWLINFDNLYIESIEIPNHYFGTQLISQF